MDIIDNQKKILLVDGNSILNRAFYGLPLLTNAEGIYTNAVYGFMNILFKVMGEETPTHIGIAFDLKAPTFRHKMFKEYKGTRKGMPDELRQQVPLIKDLLSAMKVDIFEKEGYEADDILGTLSKHYENLGFDVIVLSGDRDLLQLASKKIKIKIPKTKKGKTEVEEYYETDVFDKYGVTPEEFIDVKGLMGDTSDNIPGVPGIGEKTAVKIIKQYHDMETAIKNADDIKPKRASENLKQYSEQAVLSKKLAKICVDCPIKRTISEFKQENFMTQEFLNMLKKLEFKTLLTKFTNLKSDLKTGNLNDHDKYKFDYKMLNTKSEVEQFINNDLINISTIAFKIITDYNKIIGISIAYKDKGAVYIEQKEEFTIEKALNMLKPIFENKSVKKIGYHVKTDIHILRKFNITLNGLFFDVMLAAYLLNPTKDTYHIDELAKQYLNESVISESSVLGTGKKKKHLQEVSEDEKSYFTAVQSNICFRLKNILEEKLKETDMYRLYNEIEMPLIYVLADMEENGIRVKVDELKKYSNNLETVINSITKEIFDMAGEEFNINSPKQLGEILFTKLKLPIIKKTKTGYSTAAEVLEKLKSKHAIIDKILEYRQLVKLKTTYADGLFSFIDKETKKIYSSFNQTVTATGRISSTEPNLQNIPIKVEMGRKIRKVFVPSSDEYVFVDADYSQIELRLLAHLSGDEILIKAYNENEDIHRLTASQVFNTSIEKVTTTQRSNAKAVNFGIIYGIGAFSLSKDLGITRKEADNYIKSYLGKYPLVKVYLDYCVSEAKEKGYAVTMFGRRRYIAELKSRNFMQRSFGERVAKNMPIQGTAADIIKIAMINVNNKLKQNNMKSKLILQVHDELLIEAHKDELDKVKEILENEMMNAVKLLVPLIVDIHVGENWYESK